MSDLFYWKMYIAVREEVPDHMVPVLVAHSVINAHVAFSQHEDYLDWFKNSYRKVVVSVSEREFLKIDAELAGWRGHENTVMEGKPSCIVCFPVLSNKVPNVLKFTKLWKPK